MTAILTTKFHIPQTRSKSLSRQRLIEQLESALHNKHRLICLVAPAGFGKSTLLSTWLNAKPHSTAWLSLDENDNRLPRFLYYLLTTLKPHLPALGEEDFGLLQTEQEPPVEPILAAVINVANALSEPLLLVLEDYHLVNNPKIDAAVNFLLEHLPEHLHLIITSREDPDLSLSRLRVRDQLTEIRADDLRFNSTEVSAFLQEMAGLDLSPEQIALLEGRTEGWIAGLQLAVLSLNKVTDKAQFLTSFGGSHRYIMDYLVDEVLDLQSEGEPGNFYCKPPSYNV